MHEQHAPNGAEQPTPDFDYSTPEARRALENVTAIIASIRDEHLEMAGKVRLYERTLGLAVVPVLLRRAAIIAWRKVGKGRNA